MLVVCGWCQRQMRDGPGDAVSHGLCPTCEKFVRREAGIEAFTDAEKLALFDRFWFGGDSSKKRIDWRKLDPREIELGLAEEYEHAPDEVISMKTVLDHLVNDPKYYSKLKQAGL